MPETDAEAGHRFRDVGHTSVVANRIENYLSSCQICQRLDPIAEVAQCTDHAQCAHSLGLLAHRRSPFLIANTFMQRIQISWYRRCVMAPMVLWCPRRGTKRR